MVSLTIVSQTARDFDTVRPVKIGGSPKQKERFSRAWVIAAAAAADFTYEIVADDERGVDMTVHSHDHTLDFQLKATSRPEVRDDCLLHDLDVRTYNLLRPSQRSGYGVLAVVVVSDDPASWHVMDHDGTNLSRSAYYCGPQGYVAVDHLCSVSGHLRSVPEEEGLAGRFDDLRCHRREVVDLADAFNLSEESVDEAEVAAGDAGDRGDGGGLSQVVFVRVLI